MFYPDLKKFKELSNEYSIIPVFREVILDYHTPVSSFLSVAKNEKICCLLESVEKQEKWGRYSFISWRPKIVFKAKNGTIFFEEDGKRERIKTLENPLYYFKKRFFNQKVATLKGLPIFSGGAIGYIAYDFIRYLEKLPAIAKDDFNLPDVYLFLTDILLIFDHYKHTSKIVKYVHITKKDTEYLYKQACLEINRVLETLGRHHYQVTQKTPLKKYIKTESNISRSDFLRKVKKIKEYIYAGEIVQAVISQRFSCKIKIDPFNIYRALRLINPSPYMYYLKLDNFYIIGSSPEILVRKENNTAITKPIAGTRPRGTSERMDKKLEEELINSEKDKAEHLMLVDLGRNDLGRVSKANTIEVRDFMTVEKYSHVMHLVTTVSGNLNKNCDMFDLFCATFPAGTVTGAPKIRAMEIIEALEPTKRGPYAGAVGYFSYNKNMDMAITIRTIVYKNNTAYIQAGAGIVADSIPEEEYQETVNKAKALFQAIELARSI